MSLKLDLLILDGEMSDNLNFYVERISALRRSLSLALKLDREGDFRRGIGVFNDVIDNLKSYETNLTQNIPGYPEHYTQLLIPFKDKINKTHDAIEKYKKQNRKLRDRIILEKESWTEEYKKLDELEKQNIVSVRFRDFLGGLIRVNGLLRITEIASRGGLLRIAKESFFDAWNGLYDAKRNYEQKIEANKGPVPLFYSELTNSICDEYHRDIEKWRNKLL